MDPGRARALLSAERRRIEQELTLLVRQDDGEIPDATDPGNLAPQLAQAEFDEGRAQDLRAQPEAVERAERRLTEGTYGLSIESGKPDPRRAA